MSLAVWPSAFIRFAVETCSALATFRGRPNLVPLARDVCRFSAVRSLVNSRSYSARIREHQSSFCLRQLRNRYRR